MSLFSKDAQRRAPRQPVAEAAHGPDVTGTDRNAQPGSKALRPLQDPFDLSPRAIAQRAALGHIHGSPAGAGQRQRFSRLFGSQAQPVQRLAISNTSMKKCGFALHNGIEWIWYNDKGRQPNHVSALLDGGNVDHIHAKTTFKGGLVNRLDWDEGADGEWAGPVTWLDQAKEEWGDWQPDAINAGELTIRLLKAKALNKAKD